MANRRTVTIMDVWREASPYFMGYSEEAPEIVLYNMTKASMQDCLLYLLEYSREVTSQFVMLNTQIKVVTPSPIMAARALAGGHIGGGLWLDLPILPTLGIFVDSPSGLSISFVRGEWDAMTLCALFVLLRDLAIIAPEVHISLDGLSYDADEKAGFVSLVQAYCRESA